MDVVSVSKPLHVSVLCTAFSVSRGKHYEYPGESHDFWEMVYIADGHAGITAGSRVLTCRPGTIIFHKPNEFHRIWNAGDSNLDFTVVSFMVSGDYIRQLADKVLYPDEATLSLVLRLRQEIAAGGPDDRLMPSRFRRDPAAAAAFTALLEYFLHACVHADNVLDAKSTGSALLFRSAVELMQKHMADPLSVKDIAHSLHISHSQLKRLFHRYALTGVHEYFLVMRINRAKMLLAQGETVCATAAAVGFSDQNYFSAAFKRVTGVTPSKWWHDRA